MRPDSIKIDQSGRWNRLDRDAASVCLDQLAQLFPTRGTWGCQHRHFARFRTARRRFDRRLQPMIGAECIWRSDAIATAQAVLQAMTVALQPRSKSSRPADARDLRWSHRPCRHTGKRRNLPDRRTIRPASWLEALVARSNRRNQNRTPQWEQCNGTRDCLDYAGESAKPPHSASLALRLVTHNATR